MNPLQRFNADVLNGMFGPANPPYWADDEPPFDLDYDGTPTQTKDKRMPANSTVTYGRDTGSADVPVKHRGQVRMAEAFVKQHADRLRFVHNIGWHVWDGCRWRPDDERVEIPAALATVKTALRSLDRYSGQERDDLYRDIQRCESKSALEGVAYIASALPPISTSARSLDADPYLFNTSNGTLDLRTGEMFGNRRSDLITKLSGGTVTGDVHSAEWEAFIERILPDPEIRSFVQRLFGYAMLGKVSEHVMPIFTGSGANGKGTLRDAVMSAFGDYATEVDPAILMESKHERHGTFRMRLRGARLVFVSETEKDRRFSEATMKRLTGGDPIEANLMHRDPITFDPSHTLIMLTNHLPQVSGDDPAVWRRILVVPFDTVIPEAERDGELPERLRLAGNAITSWVYDGWLDYRKQGLNPPEAVKGRTKAYQDASDTLGRFLGERTNPTPHGHIRARELFNAWKNWCLDNREEPGTEKAFAMSMKARGFEKKSASVGTLYRGMVLLADDGDDDRP